MGMAVGNVTNILNNKVHKEIKMFLNDKLELSNSVNTVKAYESDIRTFFRFIRGKEIEYLTIQDIQIPNDDLRLYKNYLLKDLGNSSNTAFRKYSTIRSLYDYFYTYNLVDEESLKSLNKVKIVNKEKSQNHHGHLSVEEVLKMANIILNGKDKHVKKREVKYYLILFALDTCLRKTAILNLTWKDFDVRDDCVIVNAVDKGNKHFRPKISKEFYSEMVDKLKKDEGKVFNISIDAINDMMHFLNEKMGFPKERHITFHSFRKAGVTFQYRISGDLLQAKKAANHSSAATTELYINDTDYGALGAVSSKGNIDNELYKKVTHEQLIKGIESLTKDQLLLLNIKLREIIE